MIDPGWIREGMTVRDMEGRKLGTVASLQATQFEVEQGWPARRDYVVTLHAVARSRARTSCSLPTGARGCLPRTEPALTSGARRADAGAPRPGGRPPRREPGWRPR